MSLRKQIGLELFRRYRHINARLHPLHTLFWECTLRCNMRCRHCGSDCKVSSEVQDMPAADFLAAVDRLMPHIDPHTTFVVMTGGETLLREDIEAVGLELYRRGFPWGLVTNGYLLDEARLASLQQAGIHSISVSFDGLADDHNWIRQHPGSHAAVERAVGLLRRSHDLLWDVVTCVSPRNYASLPQFRDRLVELGVPRWRVFTIFPMGRAARDPELQLTDEQFRGTLDFIKACRNNSQLSTVQQLNNSTSPSCNNSQLSTLNSQLKVSYACEGFLGDYEREVRDQFFYCRAGIEVMSIRCNGDISGCTSIRSNFSQGNIYRDDLWEVWQNRFQKFRDRSWTHKEQCARCKVFRYCEGSGLHLYDEQDHLLGCHYQRLLNRSN